MVVEKLGGGRLYGGYYLQSQGGCHQFLLFIHFTSCQVIRYLKIQIISYNNSFAQNAFDMFITLKLLLKTQFNVIYNSKRWKRPVLTYYNGHQLQQQGFIQAILMSGRRHKKLNLLIEFSNAIFIKFYFKAHKNMLTSSVHSK